MVGILPVKTLVRKSRAITLAGCLRLATQQTYQKKRLDKVPLLPSTQHKILIRDRTIISNKVGFCLENFIIRPNSPRVAIALEKANAVIPLCWLITSSHVLHTHNHANVVVRSAKRQLAASLVARLRAQGLTLLYDLRVKSPYLIAPPKTILLEKEIEWSSRSLCYQTSVWI